MLFSLRKWLPNYIKEPLWGSREKWGFETINDDPDWIEWQTIYSKFYQKNQREGIGKTVNDAGYKIMTEVDMTNKTVLEIGAGDIRHLKYFNTKPKEYILADVSSDMMSYAINSLKEKGIKHKCIMLERNQIIPVHDESVDIVVSFYSLEHLYPLENYLKDISRVLKPGGVLIGAIPCEGGLAWGLGRLLTSRRWMQKNTNINYDKIICWEHPNFADDIIKCCDTMFQKNKITLWPNSWIPSIDANLVLSFCYIKTY